ncbi:hypothetical protein HPB52_012058 [Rhipicephalus sanguineus]|uniref:Uncharacterized protein n=1 Tax=Rhipicephalus sanguineus TaxID=34632 RepID=A0A9D4PIT4_RHISA|nr:hypothetical protein HPB52_012058 [Rhipicephalus sanguineus]
MLVTVESDCDNSSNGIAEANLSVLLARQICVARGIVQLKRKITQLLITNFSGEYQHLTKRTAIAHFEAIGDEAFSRIAPIAAAAECDTAVASTSSHVSLLSRYIGDQDNMPFDERPLPCFHDFPPVPPFHLLDAILTLNGVAAQPPMHDILLDALPIELRHLAAASSSSTQPYEDLCAAVLAGYGQTCQPLPARLEFQASPPNAASGANWPVALSCPRPNSPDNGSFYLDRPHEHQFLRPTTPTR